MTARAARRIRSGSWHNSSSAISTVVTATSTDDPMACVVTVPMPTLHVVFGGDAHGDISLIKVFDARRRDDTAEGPNMADPIDCPIDPDGSATAPPGRIELAIDSLPNYILIEPIPVAIDPIDDTAFTAWVRNLETNATGSTVVEALLMLKERIEIVYEDLAQRRQLTNEQKMTLQMLHTYIAPKKPEWV